jgi:hypothetical protein
LIQCNIVSVNEMTRLILPQMVERKKGAVINLSSLSAAMCTPLLSVYSGTKSYVDRLKGCPGRTRDLLIFVYFHITLQLNHSGSTFNLIGLLSAGTGGQSCSPQDFPDLLFLKWPACKLHIKKYKN